MKINVLPLLGLIFVLSATTGCRTFKVDYNQAYVPAAERSDATIPGKAIVLAEPDDYNYMYSGRPDSFHAGGTTLEMPLGKIVCETAMKVMEGVFTEGCVKAEKFPRSGKHAAVVQVRASRFKYAFNQMRNLTMAITPQVELAIEVVLLDKSRTTYFSRVYDSGTVNDKTTLDTLQPGETVNKLTHKIARDLLNRAASDIRATLEARQPAAEISGRKRNAPEPADDGNDESGSVRDRLRELKKLHEDGLISKEVYEERQKKILDSN